MNRFKLIQVEEIDELAEEMNKPENVTGQLINLTYNDTDEIWVAVLHWSSSTLSNEVRQQS